MMPEAGVRQQPVFEARRRARETEGRKNDEWHGRQQRQESADRAEGSGVGEPALGIDPAGAKALGRVLDQRDPVLVRQLRDAMPGGRLPEDVDELDRLRLWFAGGCAASQLGFQEVRVHRPRGRVGVDEDDATAAYWYQLAADQNLPIAMRNLANMYAGGYGVPFDESLAESWYEKAAKMGDPVAIKRMATLRPASEFAAAAETTSVAEAAPAAPAAEPMSVAGDDEVAEAAPAEPAPEPSPAPPESRPRPGPVRGRK